MTDEEILQGIDKLEDGIPFDEIRNGDKWLDIHELFSEIRERIKWHYPSKGELPEISGEYLVKVNYHDGKTHAFMSICEFNTKYQSWCFCGNRDIVAWQYIVPPKEKE